MIPGRTSIRDVIVADKAIIASVMVLSVLARGQMLFHPFYAVDTYAMTGQPFSELSELFYSQGRFGLVLVYWIRDLIGFQGFDVAFSANLAASLMMAVAGTLAADAVMPTASTWARSAFAVVFALHPFGTEFFHFSEAAFAIALSILISVLAVHLALRPHGVPMALTWTVLLMVFAFSIYQTTAAILVSVCLFATVAEVMQHGILPLRATMSRPSVRAMGLLAVSVLLYAACATAIIKATGIAATPRADLSPLLTFQGIIGKVSVVGLAIWRGTLNGFGLMGPSGGPLLTLLLVSSAMFLAIALARRGLLALVAGGFLILGAFVASVLPPTVSADVWLVPRTIWGIVVPCAALIGMGIMSAPRVASRGLLAVLAILCLVYIGTSNRIAMDQRRVNAWDASHAVRILGRLEGQEGFGAVTTLAVIGGPTRRSATTVGDMNTSGLGVPWAKLGVFREASGYRFLPASEAEAAVAKAYCANAGAWPALAATRIAGTLAIVCLSPD